MMNNMVSGIRAKLDGAKDIHPVGQSMTTNQPGGASGEGGTGEGTHRRERERVCMEEMHRANMEMMANSSKAMTTLMSWMQEGNKLDYFRIPKPTPGTHNSRETELTQYHAKTQLLAKPRILSLPGLCVKTSTD
jgi:hypothetical protein